MNAVTVQLSAKDAAFLKHHARTRPGVTAEALARACLLSVLQSFDDPEVADCMLDEAISRTPRRCMTVAM